MSQQLIPFVFDSHEVRVIDQYGNPWFILRDLLDAMESKTTTTAAVESIKQGLGDGFVNDIPILDSLGREQQVIIVAESATTYLLSRSNTEKGKELNRFIHIEVLPTLRKTGSYSTPFSNSTKPNTALIETADVVRVVARALRAAGLTGNALTIAADNVGKTVNGISLLGLAGATHLIADQRGKVYTPTDLGLLMNPPIGPIKFNLLLESSGFQKKELGSWVPTEKAQGLYEWADTGKKHSNGTPVKQLRWFKAVLDHPVVVNQKEAA